MTKCTYFWTRFRNLPDWWISINRCGVSKKWRVEGVILFLIKFPHWSFSKQYTAKRCENCSLSPHVWEWSMQWLSIRCLLRFNLNCNSSGINLLISIGNEEKVLFKSQSFISVMLTITLQFFSYNSSPSLLMHFLSLLQKNCTQIETKGCILF